MKKNNKKNVIYIILIILLGIICFVAIDIMRDDWKKKHQSSVEVSLNVVESGHII